MKDILSMLQSRLAKGSNFINEYSEYSYPFNMIEEQTHADQKLMKQLWQKLFLCVVKFPVIVRKINELWIFQKQH